jgi:chitinase
VSVARNGYLLGLLIISWFASAASAAPASAPRARNQRVIGYYAGWSVERFPATQIRGDLLTHVNYAFAIIDKDNQCVPRNPKLAEKGFAQLRELKQKYPHLKTLISVGGWTDSTGFYDTAKTREDARDLRQVRRRVREAERFRWRRHRLGIPGGGGNDKGKGGPEDTKNFTALLTELRKQLDAQGKAGRRKEISPHHRRAGRRRVQAYRARSGSPRCSISST